MVKDRKTNVSKYLIDEIALMFLGHSRQVYSHVGIQNMLGMSKPTVTVPLQNFIDR